MRTHANRRRQRRIAVLALSVPGLAACNIVEPEPYAMVEFQKPEVKSELSTAHASAGDEVRLEIVVSGGDPDVDLRATVTWNTELFAYSHALPQDASPLVFSEADQGWATIDSRRDRGRFDGWVTLVFTALVDSETSGISTNATLLTDGAVRGS